jgi:hypothetical protein
MERPADWPFEDPPNVATFATRPVMDGTSWIALVSHDDEDGGWQFIGPEGASMDQAMLVALHNVLDRDATIAELADLPLGWQAWRTSRDAPWQRGPQA